MEKCKRQNKACSKRLIENVESLCSPQLSLQEQDLGKISRYLSQAIILEVCTHPKPGLVTRYSNGAHSDMSILTFAMSSAVLSEAFRHLQELGFRHQGSMPELFIKIREYGKVVEQQLLMVTKGVNTQRGILFLGGLLSAAAGYTRQKKITEKSLAQVVAMLTSGLVERELSNLQKKEYTYGEQLYLQYGVTGIRGEVEKGLPSVINLGLPAMREAFAKKADINAAIVHSLIALMTVVEDSNIIWRTDIKMAAKVKSIAQTILDKGSVFSRAGRTEIALTEEYFEAHRISPGGSADLLSITIALYLLEHKEFPVRIL